MIETKDVVSALRRRAARRARLAGDATASTAMEYALIGSLVSMAIIGALSATGTGVADKWVAFTATVIAALR